VVKKDFSMTDDLLYKEESYLIRGAVFEVYREMGCGFLEAVYQECLEKELSKQNIPFISQPLLELYYKRKNCCKTTNPI
jgi:GxxExxY protein